MSRENLHRILDLARWAPSGDNTQPWRFEVVDDAHVRIHGFDTRDHVLYDFDGHPSHIAHGALLETLRIAASGFGLSARWEIPSNADDRHPVYDVYLAESPALVRDPLFACIETRTVQRRPMKTTPLAAGQQQALVDAAGGGFRVDLFGSWGDRTRIARLLWNSAYIRLTCPEAHPVHKSIIEWHARYSKNRIPDQAIGADPCTVRLMEWVLQSWKRVHFFNRFLMGTVAPRVQLDLLPGLLCAAHLLVRPKVAPQAIADWLGLGSAVQRIWLTATHQGLHFQPQMTPVIFRWYARAERHFSADPRFLEQSMNLATAFETATHTATDDPIGFFARVGVCEMPQSRSLRLDPTELLL